jgi:hypothetical protein
VYRDTKEAEGLMAWNFIQDENHHGPPSHQERGENAQHGYLPDRIRALRMKPKKQRPGVKCEASDMRFGSDKGVRERNESIGKELGTESALNTSQ